MSLKFSLIGHISTLRDRHFDDTSASFLSPRGLNRPPNASRFPTLPVLASNRPGTLVATYFDDSTPHVCGGGKQYLIE
jgi:hypothetical protein